MTPSTRRGNAPAYALATAAGKDATLALHHARAAGLRVPLSFTLYDAATERVAFHGTRIELVRRHARAAGMEPVTAPVPEGGYEEVYLDTLRELRARGVEGVVYGNVYLADVREWYEERTSGFGLRHVEPLWGRPPGEVAREVVELGYRARIVSVDLERGDPAWLGRPLDLRLLERVEARGADPCGEHGEYHTFVEAGPALRGRVEARSGEEVEMGGHRLLDLVPLDRPPGPAGRDASPGPTPSSGGSMLDSIKAFFRSDMNPPADADEGVRKRDLRLAACALLLELAYADDEFTEDERLHLQSAIRRQYGLDRSQADRLIRMAERERVKAVDLWQFTRLIKENYSLGQKVVLAEIMWGLVYSDGELAGKEDRLMRKISNLLDLQPGYLSEARKRAEGSKSP